MSIYRNIYIVIYGPVGSGKTTAIKIAKKALEESKQFVVWESDSDEHAIFAKLISQSRKKKK